MSDSALAGDAAAAAARARKDRGGALDRPAGITHPGPRPIANAPGGTA
jgi:hypothetical protein